MQAETSGQLAFAKTAVQLAAQQCSVVKMWSVSHCPGRGRRSILMSKKREKATTWSMRKANERAAAKLAAQQNTTNTKAAKCISLDNLLHNR